VSVIDTATNALVGTPIPVGSNPRGVAIVPDQAPVASFSVVPGTAGSPSAFDAAGSSSPVGQVASYRWSFGDGQTATTTTPQTSHVYAGAGNYTATLTVANTAGTSLTQVFTGQTVSNNGGPAAITSHTVTVPAAAQSTTATFDNQQITLLTPSLQTCTAASSALGAVLESTTIPSSHATKLKFGGAAFYLGRGVKHTTKKIEHLKHGKTKKITITTWTPNATVHHLPAVLALKLTGLKTGTQTLKVVVSYKKTVTKHGHKRTETVAKTLTTKFNIC
jgi:PKD repeat protein